MSYAFFGASAYVDAPFLFANINHGGEMQNTYAY
jgi:hypothetical protein